MLEAEELLHEKNPRLIFQGSDLLLPHGNQLNELKFLLITFGNTNHHIVYQCPVKAMYYDFRF